MAQRPTLFEEWWSWLRENWQWFIPMVGTIASPIIASIISITYDYLKMKKLLP